LKKMTPIAAVLIACGLAVPVASLGNNGEAASRAPDAHADFSGFWREDHDAAPGAASAGRPPTPPGGPATQVRAAAMGHLQPWVQKRFDAFNAERAKGFEVRTRGIACLPWALPGIGLPGGATYVMDIVISKSQVVFLYQLDHQSHIVYLDRAHPRDLAATDFGNSVGHWEGDTLVVDSTGFNDRTDVYYGIAHTKALHIVERLRLVDGYLESRVTFDDPGAFTSPFSYVQAFLRTDPMQEYVCAQNNVDGNGPLPPAAEKN
jgi:hypothetical protein